LVLGLGTLNALRRRKPGLGRSADNFALDENVVRSADHDQMFDIVAADQNQAAAGVDRKSVEHAKTRLTRTAGICEGKPAARETAQTHKGDRDQRKNDAERNDETQWDGQFAAKQLIKHADFPTQTPPRAAWIRKIPNACL
jgi:hypothetical protein